MRTRRTTSLWMALACLVAAGSACGDAGPEEPTGDGSGLASSKGDEHIGFAEDGTPPSVVGSYRFELVSEVTTYDEGSLFVAPSEDTSTTRLEGVVEAVQDGADVTFYLSFCGIQLPEVAGYEPMVDAETIRRLPAVVSTGQLYDSDGVAQFQTEPSAWVVGMNLDDPLGEALPEDDQDPRIDDVDLDGEPGITMMLEGWEIYGAMRLAFQLQGAVGIGRVLSGEAQVTMDTAVFGDTVPLINVAKKIKAMREDTTVIRESHLFELSPVDASGASCEVVFDGAPAPEPEPERRTEAPEGGQTCLEALDERGIGYQLSDSSDESPDGHPDLVCTVKDPVLVDGTLAGVHFRYASVSTGVSDIFASCELVIAMHDTAQLAAAQGVTDIVHLGVYSCRTVSGSSALSEHGHANAIDVAGVGFDDGTYYSVFDDWEDGVSEPESAGGSWWLWFASELSSTSIFHAVLTPEYNAAHDDHLHCELTSGELPPR